MLINKKVVGLGLAALFTAVVALNSFTIVKSGTDYRKCNN